jgi:Domain of unknown function (DUF6391)
MTSATSQPNPFPFEFVPDSAQDADIVAQLGFVPGLKELLMLRQVHALEHATVWVLSETARTPTPISTSNVADRPTDNTSLGGVSTDRGFYLYGSVTSSQLYRAAQTALHRIQSGEWDLAVHPRCGTNVSVGMLLSAGFAFVFNQVLPKTPLEQLLGLGLAATAAAQIAPDVGEVVQRYVTTAIPFNLTIEDVLPTQDLWGRTAHFVRVGWTTAR